MLKLLERQLGMWEMQRQLRDVASRPGRCLEDGVAYGPCLLISRQRGSQGSRLAYRLGERLGWEVFDRQIVDDVAQLAHVRQQLIESVDAETRAKWDDAWRPELLPEDIGCEEYLRWLRQVMLTLGHHGDVIILGRGAQYLLPKQCAFRVRVVAPFELRVKRVAESRSVSLEEAEAHVREFDETRTGFIRKCFQRDSNSAAEYDCIVNTENLTVETAVEMVLLALRDKLGAGS